MFCNKRKRKFPISNGMKVLPLSIKKILPIYFTIELVFIGLLVLSLFYIQVPTFTTIHRPIVATYMSAPRPLVWEYISRLSTTNGAKLINLEYYGEQFDIDTDLKTFEELATVLPLDIEKEYLDTLGSLELLDDMKITIPPNQYQIGTASWYGSYFQGRPTASTEPYNMYDLTAAHKTLPLGTQVKITNIENRKEVVVRINDRGPYVGERIIDLSWEAASQLGVVHQGLAMVIIEIVE